MALDHLISEEKEHIATVKAENERKQKVEEERQRQEAIKEEERRKKREAREAKRRAEELARLKQEIQDTFIAQGLSTADIGAQEVFEIDGNKESKPIIGAIGGLLGQMILTLNIMEKNFNR